jgi:4-hydroxythreonine-4-phosphate dehydrogenase
MVHGRPLEQTDIWKSEARAPRSDIAAVLADVGLSCRVIDAAAVRSGLTHLQHAMLRLACEADVVLCDAETDDDLRTIAAASMVLDNRTVWAGSAGLAWHLPHAAGLVRTSNNVPQMNLASGPTLFVVGSLASPSREQAGILAAMPDVVTVNVSPASLLESQTASMQIAEALQSGRDVLALLDDSERCAGEQAQLLTRGLSHIVAPCAHLIGGLVATGGETARAILDNLGIRRLRLLGEVQPGLPLSAADEWTRNLPVLTKAGAFGSPQTLVRCRELLKKLQRASTPTEAQSRFEHRES